MAQWKKKLPGPDIGGTDDPIPISGRDAPGHGYDPAKTLQAGLKSIAPLQKDSDGADSGNAGTTFSDNPSNPAILGPTFSWHKLPQQKENKTHRKVPKLVHGAYIIKFDPDEARDKQGKWTASEDMPLTKVGEQLGSNPGGKYKDAQGQKYYVKFYKNPQQGHTEALASKIFEQMGIQTPQPKMTSVNGKTALVTKWGNYENLTKQQLIAASPAEKIQLAKMYYAAALTTNWDVVGMTFDNVVRDKGTGNLVEVDAGGSFNFRAMGDHKDYTPAVGELQTLKDPTKKAGSVFHSALQDPAAAKAGLQAVKNLDMGHIKTLFEQSAIHNQAQLYDAFSKKRDTILKDTVSKDSADSEPTNAADGQGRPQWMMSPGQGGVDPVYRSQKPDGNKDELFSKNINKNPPTFQVPDQNDYLLW